MARPAAAECVRVAVRCRPLSERERADRQAEVVAVDAAAAQVTLRAAGEAPRPFTFDRAFGPEAGQDEVYEAMAAPLVESALAGYNATLFAFGQTGTGKVGGAQAGEAHMRVVGTSGWLVILARSDLPPRRRTRWRVSRSAAAAAPPLAPHRSCRQRQASSRAPFGTSLQPLAPALTRPS